MSLQDLQNLEFDHPGPKAVLPADLTQRDFRRVEKMSNKASSPNLTKQVRKREDDRKKRRKRRLEERSRKRGDEWEDDAVDSKAHVKKKQRQPSPPEDEAPSGGVYEVEGLCGSRRGPDGKIEYQVKWVGYDHSDNTWEPLEHFGDSMRSHVENEEWKIDDSFKVEKVLDSRDGKNGKKEYYVKWEGWLKQHGKWLPEEEVVRRDPHAVRIYHKIHDKTPPKVTAAVKEKEVLSASLKRAPSASGHRGNGKRARLRGADSSESDSDSGSSGSDSDSDSDDKAILGKSKVPKAASSKKQHTKKEDAKSETKQEKQTSEAKLAKETSSPERRARNYPGENDAAKGTPQGSESDASGQGSSSPSAKRARPILKGHVRVLKSKVKKLHKGSVVVHNYINGLRTTSVPKAPARGPVTVDGSDDDDSPVELLSPEQPTAAAEAQQRVAQRAIPLGRSQDDVVGSSKPSKLFHDAARSSATVAKSKPALPSAGAAAAAAASPSRKGAEVKKDADPTAKSKVGYTVKHCKREGCSKLVRSSEWHGCCSSECGRQLVGALANKLT